PGPPQPGGADHDAEHELEHDRRQPEPREETERERGEQADRDDDQKVCVVHSGHVEAAVAPVTLSSSRSRPDSRLPTGRPSAEGWPAAATAGYVWPGFQDGSARTLGRRVRAEAASVLRGRACVAS